jgi:polar amino acid transport system permease protein
MNQFLRSTGGFLTAPALRRSLLDIAKFLAVAAAASWLLINGTSESGYHWQWYRIPEFVIYRIQGEWHIGPLVAGLLVTLRITAVSLILAFVVGLLTALMRLSNSWLANLVARGYLELVRNTPLLVQLFFIYFVLAPVLEINAFSSAVLALSLFEGAYASEIFRAGILSIQREQWEAAFSIGLNTRQTYRLVVLPQAIRRMLPPLASQAVSLIKDSALVSTIAIYDLTMRAQAIIAETFLVFEVWLATAAIYLCLTMILSMTVFYLENRLRVDY